MIRRIVDEPAPVLVTLALAALVGLGLGWAFEGRGAAPPSEAERRPGTTGQTTTPMSEPVPTAPAEGTPTSPEKDPSTASGLTAAAVSAALAQGVKAADPTGRAAIAVWADSWDAPVVAGKATTPARMWSMSKPVVAVALLQAAQGKPSRAVSSAMRRAIVRSENCRQRRVVLGLQVLTGGASAARKAVGAVLDQAGAAEASPAEQVGGADDACVDYLRANPPDGGDPLRGAALFGTSTWSARDAVAFARALAVGTYGANGETVLKLMRSPKARSEEGAAQFTARLDWGAGRVFRKWRPAYKAGWGGAGRRDFLVGQIVVLDVGGQRVAVAATFHPDRQPPSDDPGTSDGPAGLETLLRPLASEFERAERASAG